MGDFFEHGHISHARLGAQISEMKVAELSFDNELREVHSDDRVVEHVENARFDELAQAEKAFIQRFARQTAERLEQVIGTQLPQQVASHLVPEHA